MIFCTGRTSFVKVFILVLALFLIGGSVSVFSQEIITTFGLGSEFIEYDKKDPFHNFGDDWFVSDETVPAGVKLDVSVLFIGRTGLTVSAGTDILFKIGGNTEGGVNIDPIIGLGYVYYNKFYIGGILNAIPKPYLRIREATNLLWADVFITPTFVGGYDFGNFVLGGQISYMYGPISNISGFRFSLGVGVNVGNILK